VQEINIEIHTTASDHSNTESVPMIPTNKHIMKIQHVSSTNQFIDVSSIEYNVRIGSPLPWTLKVLKYSNVRLCVTTELG